MALSDAVWERVWTMGRCFGKGTVDFKNSLVRLGGFQTEQVERSTGSWHGAADRNVLKVHSSLGPNCPRFLN